MIERLRIDANTWHASPAKNPVGTLFVVPRGPMNTRDSSLEIGLQDGLAWMNRPNGPLDHMTNQIILIKGIKLL